jgi:hypothetical protein
MQVRVTLAPSRRSGVLLIAITILALIISTALAHLVPLPSVDGASHVAGITNPVTGSALELPATSDDTPAPAHHEHFEVEHDGATPPRAVDQAGSVADLPLVRSPHVELDRVIAIAPMTQRGLPRPSLAALSINRT